MSDEEKMVTISAIAAIKEIHSKGGRELSREETIEYISRPIYMGHPMSLPAKIRGRKPTRTQYDRAYERRKGIYHKLVRLPNLRTGSGWMLNEKELEIARKIHMKCRRTTAVMHSLELSGENCPDRKTVTAALRKNNL